MNVLDGETYDDQYKEYVDFADTSFSWLYVEQPGLDRYLGDEYRADTSVLELGCGNGRVIRHLIERGVPADNITGVDSSSNMLHAAALALPSAVSLVLGKATDIPFKDESFHLVTANMVLHAMDDRELDATLDKVSDVLKPGGKFFFIDAAVDQSDSAQTLKRWVTQPSPWGTRLQVFSHDVDEVIGEMAPSHGLECVETASLEVAEAGKDADPEEYERYVQGHSRVAALLQKPE